MPRLPRCSFYLNCGALKEIEEPGSWREKEREDDVLRCGGTGRKQRGPRPGINLCFYISLKLPLQHALCLLAAFPTGAPSAHLLAHR